MSDERWMQVAVEEALRGTGTVSPNPMVGAVLVHAEKILAKGHHRYAGGPHAEVMALKSIKNIPVRATLYLTMEPCCTAGRTPPCTDLIIRSGLRRLVIGSLDPNPLHHGRGVRLLRESGVEVVRGVAAESCETINPAFAKYITQGTPFGVAKMAMSLDGKTATRSGDSRWISGAESRALVKRMRHAADAVLVGAGTVRQDNPRLTVRDASLSAKKRPLIRIVADSKLSLSPRATIFQPVRGHVTWIATTRRSLRNRGGGFGGRRGVEMLAVESSKNGISLLDLFRQLGKREITSVLIEGGPTLLDSCLKEGVVDRLAFFVAPVLIGAEKAAWHKSIACYDMRVRAVGSDVLLEAAVGKAGSA